MSSRTEDRILYLLKSRGPSTAGDLGAALKMSVAGAQQWLAKLHQTRLVEPEDRRHGRGRPRRYWHLTAEGHARFPDRHSDLTLEMLKSAAEVFGAEGLERLIAHRESTTLTRYREALSRCQSLSSRLSKLVELRNREGYMASWENIDDGLYLLFENHCPICAAAATCQGLCRSELSIFRQVLGADVEVHRVEHMLAGARRCAYEVRQIGDL